MRVIPINDALPPGMAQQVSDLIGHLTHGFNNAGELVAFAQSGRSIWRDRVGPINKGVIKAMTRPYVGELRRLNGPMALGGLKMVRPDLYEAVVRFRLHAWLEREVEIITAALS